MQELHSFEKHGAWTMVVEPLEDGGFEAVVFSVAVQNPDFWCQRTKAEQARQAALDWIAKNGAEG